MTINEPSTVREAPAEWVHRMTLRLLIVAPALLVVGAGFLLWNSWDRSGGQPGLDPNSTADARAATLAERAVWTTMFSGVGPLLLLFAMMLLCSALVVAQRPWDASRLLPARGVGLQPEIVGLTAAASLLALVQLMAAFLGLTVSGPLTEIVSSGSLAANLAANAATLCLAVILIAQWWASAGLPSNTAARPSNADGLPANTDGLQTRH
jgi:hypothetical protein